ncbi:MAG: DUF2461 domain-containing protein, partial [Chloroflexi bacterium]|nr:DUF2461 domain-containing protein [Chloroflexota bacterium]
GGFKPQLLQFLSELSANNTRDWFQAHYTDYQAVLVQPAKEFVLAMGDVLPELRQDIRAEPKIYGSILPITRDTRFSKDKTPYKTHLDLWFWQPIDDAPSRECPGYYLRILPEALMLGAGMHRFSDQAQAAFRRAVQEPAHAEHLARTTRQLAESGYELAGETLKRAPNGNDWQKYTGLHASQTFPVPDDFYSERLTQWCLEHYRRLAPLQQWLVEILRE